MRIDGATANPTPRIIGVVDDGAEQPAAYVRADELLNWVPDTVLGSGNFGPAMQVLMSPHASETEQILRARLVAGGLPADEFNVNTINSKERIGTQLALIRYVFLGMAGLVLLSQRRRGVLGSGLVAAYVLNLALNHWLGGAIYVQPGYLSSDPDIVALGFQQSTFALGAFAVEARVAGRFRFGLGRTFP